MKDFSKITEIDIEDQNSWQGKIFLTFDVDWANDNILLDTINFVENYGIKSTWFITHETPLLDRLRENPNCELGIHPNFNNLLDGINTNGKNSEEVIDRLINIVPEARIVRSHSLAQSERIFDIFAERNLHYVCNTYIPYSSVQKIKPWNLWSGLMIIPHFWQDNVTLKMPTENLSNFSLESLNVFNFHPIHIYLNSDKQDRYEQTRHLHQKPEELLKHRFEGDGIRKKLTNLLNLSK